VWQWWQSDPHLVRIVHQLLQPADGRAGADPLASHTVTTLGRLLAAERQSPPAELLAPPDWQQQDGGRRAAWVGELGSRSLGDRLGQLYKEAVGVTLAYGAVPARS
jgi:hypothetical protein